MARSYDSSDLVHLPVLDASAAQALGEEMIVAAKGERLPAAVAGALEELASAHTALEGAVARRLPVSPGPDAARARIADRALDAAWSTLHGVVKAWSRVPHHPQGAVAAALLPKLFPEGLKFTLLPYKLEWAESSSRLRLIEEHALGADLEKLGCASLLPLIRAAHDEYGDAVGVTAAAEPETAPITIRDAFDGFSSALRDYIVRVVASTSKRDPETRARAQALLAPLLRWESPRRRARGATGEIETAVAGVDSPADPPALAGGRLRSGLGAGWLPLQRAREPAAAYDAPPPAAPEPPATAPESDSTASCVGSRPAERANRHSQGDERRETMS